MDINTIDQKIEVGNIVRPITGHYLRSGASQYGAAVVISVEPFVIVSEEADMRWSQEEAKDFNVVGKATDEQLAVCMTRL